VAARQRPLSDASVNSYVRGLRGFASWLYEQEYTDTNLLGRLKAPKMTKKVVDILSDEEIARILVHLKTPTVTNVRRTRGGPGDRGYRISVTAGTAPPHGLDTSSRQRGPPLPAAGTVLPLGPTEGSASPVEAGEERVAGAPAAFLAAGPAGRSRKVPRELDEACRVELLA
jgi:hypothetical protein